MALEKFSAPALPIPTPEYNQEQFIQVFRALRLYFNQLDSLTPNQAESYRADHFYGGDFSGDGYGLRFPHIAASDSTDQIAGGNNTPTVVNWNTLDSGYGWLLQPPGSAIAKYEGIYKITYSLEFVNSSNAIHFVTVWLKVNGDNLINSSTKFFVPSRKSSSPGEEGHLCAYSEVTFQVSAGDEIELYWATDLAGNPTVPTDGVYMLADPAQTSPYSRPAIPSAVGSIVFLSYPPTPTVSGVSASGLLGTVTVTIT